jgi:hypothetical protein
MLQFFYFSYETSSNHLRLNGKIIVSTIQIYQKVIQICLSLSASVSLMPVEINYQIRCHALNCGANHSTLHIANTSFVSVHNCYVFFDDDIHFAQLVIVKLIPIKIILKLIGICRENIWLSVLRVMYRYLKKT